MIILKTQKTKRRVKKLNREILFKGDDALFKQLASSAKSYGEFGCGQSTVWVNKSLDIPILTIDTSREWLELVKSNCRAPKRIFFKHVNMGDIEKYGRPSSYSHDHNFPMYTDFIWNNGGADLVLIDGRFRVCCFLVTLMRGCAGTKIIFDDYTDRKHYHIVERILKPAEYCGRQALFIIPDRGELQMDKIQSMVINFRYVMD